MFFPPDLDDGRFVLVLKNKLFQTCLGGESKESELSPSQPLLLRHGHTCHVAWHPRQSRCHLPPMKETFGLIYWRRRPHFCSKMPAERHQRVYERQFIAFCRFPFYFLTFLWIIYAKSLIAIPFRVFRSWIFFRPRFSPSFTSCLKRDNLRTRFVIDSQYTNMCVLTIELERSARASPSDSVCIVTLSSLKG